MTTVYDDTVDNRDNVAQVATSIITNTIIKYPQNNLRSTC